MADRQWRDIPSADNHCGKASEDERGASKQ
jgi:hypothetical protein